MRHPSSERRHFIKQAAGLTLAPTLATLPGLSRAADASQIVVGTWGGDYQNLLQQFISPLVKAQNIDVLFETANATARNTKLKAERNARRGSMDIAALGELDMYDASLAGVLELVTAENIPNLANTIDTFRTPYSIPHIFSAMVLVYNTQAVSKPPAAIKDALKPEYKGKVGLSDALFNFSTLFVSLAEGGKGDSFEPGYAFLEKLKANSPKVFPSNEAIATAFKSGEITMAFMWKARALQWKNAGLPLDFVIPEEGAIPVTFEAAVPKNSRNKDAAWKYMNALLAPEGQVHFARTMGYAPTVRNATLPPDLQATVGFTDAELARIHPIKREVLAAHRASNLDFWNKQFKAGL